MKVKTDNITKSQRQIIIYIYEFRFLCISHLQYLFNHKDPHRIKEWLHDLEKKKYLSIIKHPKDQTKPYIFCLAQKSRWVVREKKEVQVSSLKWLYQEKLKSSEFIQKCLFLADCYLYFLRNKDKSSKINFFTKQVLEGYDYFPDPMPDAYIDEESRNTNNRYFLDYFNANDSAKYMRFKIGNYFRYFSDGNSWQENTGNATIPSILLVFDNDRKKKHIYYYAKSLLQKSFTTLDIFLASTNQIKFSKNNEDVWEKVET